MRRLISVVLVFLCIISEINSQDSGYINLKAINQRKVRNYVHSREIDRMQDFSTIRPSCRKDDKESGFKMNEKIFYLKSRLSNVWNGYRQADPIKAFNGRNFRLELVIMKNNKNVFYKNAASLPLIDTGQLYFFDIRILKGIVNVPMAFEIINIDDSRKVLEVSYIEGNKASGKQQLCFYDNGDGRTRVVHRSYFKSHSWLRDTFLYPYFHRRLVREYHRKMEKFVEGNKDYLITGVY